MVDPDLLAQHLVRTDQLLNGSSGATQPSHTEDSLTRTSGIISGAVAAAVFIAFILGLYTVLWKCMVSPPQRKSSKLRFRVQQRCSL